MAAAYGKLFVCCRDGSVIRFIRAGLESRRMKIRNTGVRLAHIGTDEGRGASAPAAMLLLLLAGCRFFGPGSVSAGETPSQRRVSSAFAGSSSCRNCHERFYELWATSHHGLAMQPYTAAFARNNLTVQEQEIEIGAFSYRAFTGAGQGFVREKGPSGERRYRIVHVLGGKNVYYFLTPMQRGRLQTLPVAYDVRSKTWFDTAASGVRHFPGTGGDEPVHWTDPLYTFNTSCYTCHVSQLSRNYDLETDTYDTSWTEPGINCETCHGPADRHVEAYQQAEETGVKPEELGLISTRTFSAEQTNSMCNTCHAKMSPITTSFTPGARYFDHFDLVTLENPDFYPDGRDLGENYTMTTWCLSPCAKSGKLDCMHCHTSSGRYRFKNTDTPNAACLPCHQQRVDNAVAHTHHEPDSTGNRCVACHMPMTYFARMARSDHSMRPPTPAATLRFESPNACNICHEDEDAGWADEWVRQWHADDYQKPVLEVASLVDAARRGNWGRLDEMLAYIQSPQRDEVIAASLLRLLCGCESEAKWPVAIAAVEKDASPLVRAAAAQALDGYRTAESLTALARATGDAYRLVRVRAAAALAAIPLVQFREEHRAQVQRAVAELIASLNTLPDNYTSHYNLGNIHMERLDYDQALRSYRTAIKLRPDCVAPYVNMAFVYNATGDNDKAEASFRKALAIDPNSAVVQLNLGMLLGELKRPKEAEEAFRAAWKADPNLAPAAYNLGVLLSKDQPDESLDWCRKAFRLRPDDGKYGYTYAFFLHQQGQTGQATSVLEGMVARHVPYADAYALLGSIYLRRGDLRRAAGVYRAAAANERLDPRTRQAFEAMIGTLE